MKKLLNHAALFIGLVLISYPYLAKKIPFLPQLTRSRTLRSTDIAAWQVKPGSIYDGDTLRLIGNNQELKVRLCGIDAPELKQPLGIESRDYLRLRSAQWGSPYKTVEAQNLWVFQQLN